jgi:hypothetical protein
MRCRQVVASAQAFHQHEKERQKKAKKQALAAPVKHGPKGYGYFAQVRVG